MMKMVVLLFVGGNGGISGYSAGREIRFLFEEITCIIDIKITVSKSTKLHLRPSSFIRTRK